MTLSDMISVIIQCHASSAVSITRTSKLRGIHNSCVTLLMKNSEIGASYAYLLCVGVGVGVGASVGVPA
jgi:hypothetical protein